MNTDADSLRVDLSPDYFTPSFELSTIDVDELKVEADASKSDQATV